MNLFIHISNECYYKFLNVYLLLEYFHCFDENFSYPINVLLFKRDIINKREKKYKEEATKGL